MKEHVSSMIGSANIAAHSGQPVYSDQTCFSPKNVWPVTAVRLLQLQVVISSAVKVKESRTRWQYSCEVRSDSTVWSKVLPTGHFRSTQSACRLY